MDTQKLLVADDSLTILKAVELALRGHHYEIKKATTGKEALAIAQVWHPHIVLADTKIPDGDGFFLSHAIKSSRELKATRVILLHSPSENMSSEKLKNSLADGSLMKPFNVSSLTHTLGSKVSHEEKKPVLPQAHNTEKQFNSDVEKITREVIERIGWEVVPELSEKIIREELDKILKKSPSK